MIMDSLANLTHYTGISAAIDKAISFLGDSNIEELETGRIDIDGDRVFALVQSYDTRSADSFPFEAHRNYIDLQLLVSGTETMLWAPVETLPVSEAYDPDKDAAFYNDGTHAPLSMESGWFCIFFPWDAHKPGCRSGSRSETVRKIVVKCRVEQ